jgi:hypothetical protein
MDRGVVVNDEEIIARLDALATRLGMNYGELAVIAGVGVPTMRFVRETKRLPRRRSARDAISRFVAVNADAKSRLELRISRV